MNWGMEGNIEEEDRSDVLKLILYELSATISSSPARLVAIREALEEFNHDDEDKHNEELEHKADQVLFQKLAFAFATDRTSDEVGLVAAALEMVYRASRARVALSFSEMGEAILPLFIEMIRAPESLLSENNINPIEKHPEKVMHDAMEDHHPRKIEGKPTKPVYEPTKNLHAPEKDDATYVNPWLAGAKDDPSFPSTQHSHPQHDQEDVNPAEDDTYGDTDNDNESYTYDDDDATDTDNDSAKVQEEAAVDDDAQTYLNPWTTKKEIPLPPKSSSPVEDGDEERTSINPWKGKSELPQKPDVPDTPEEAEAENNMTYVDQWKGKSELPQKPDAPEEAGAEDNATYVNPWKGKPELPQKPDAPDEAEDNATYVNPWKGTTDLPQKPAASEEAEAEDNATYVNPWKSVKGDPETDTAQPQSQVEGDAAEENRDTIDRNTFKRDTIPKKDEIGSGDHDSEQTPATWVGDSEYGDDNSNVIGGDLNAHINAQNLKHHERNPEEADGLTTIYTYDRADPNTFDTIKPPIHETIPEEDEEEEEASTDEQESYYDKNAHDREQENPIIWDDGVANEHNNPQPLHQNEHDDIHRDNHMDECDQKVPSSDWQEQSTKSTLRPNNVGLHRNCIQTNPLAISKVLKVLRYYSRVLSAMVPMAHQPGLLNALMYQMERRPNSVLSAQHDNNYNPQIPPHDQNQPDHPDVTMSRIDAIATIVNLACAEENKITMVYHPGLLDAVLRAANLDPSEEAREHAAIVIMNLAYAEENKVYMVNQDGVLETLVNLLSDESPFTRRYASAALFTLACVFANTARMARHCDGQILEALRKVLLNDPVDEARINAAEALFNMARNNSEDTVEQMGNHPQLLKSLAHSVITDYSADVRAYAARALEWLAADIHHPMRSHDTLLSALATASQWTKTTCIAQALKTQSTITENRRPMAEHTEVLTALANLALLDGINDEEVRSCAIIAIERLTTEPSTRHIMVKNEGIMTALTRATFSNNADLDEDTDGLGEDDASVLMKIALKNLAHEL